MRPEAFFGFNPAPGSPPGLVALADSLRTVTRALVRAQTALEGLLSLAGSIWAVTDLTAGRDRAAVEVPVQQYVRRLVTLEEPLMVCLQALEVWREGVSDRHAQTAELVDRYADLAGQSGAEGRRAQLLATATELRAEHDRAANDLTQAFAELSETVTETKRRDQDLAAELELALLSLTADIDAWLQTEAPALLRTATSLADVARLTTVISELVGVAAVGRTPGETSGVTALISRSPGSHRLIRALSHPWEQVSADSLPVASFIAQRSSGLTAALAGGPAEETAEHAD